MIQRLLSHHVLANLTFVLVLLIGTIAYNKLPRQQDPTINFNWLVVTTALPGASAEDVETRVTDPLEDAIRSIADIKFASSNSRQGISSLLVRFEDISSATFDKRVADLRREIQNAESELPEAATDPVILELTSANAFPSVMVAVTAAADDENLRRQARAIEADLEQLAGVDRVDPIGLDDPELQINFDPAALQALGLSPTALADSVQLWFNDIAAGQLALEGEAWLVRLVGRDAAPARIARMPLLGMAGEEVQLGRVARIERGREKPRQDAVLNGRPAIQLAVMKKDNANTLTLVEQVKRYLLQRNALQAQTGVRLELVDDQTLITRTAISLMQNNALIGLTLVLLVAWLFLGWRIAALTAMAIPFILAGTFWVLWGLDETLNVTVLLGTVIVLGMLVDDAVVVVEAIYYRLQQGMPVLDAAEAALKEVARPVTSAVLTTIAAFMPLMLLPGILGDFMRVIPMVVTIALAISLLEAFWMLPAHVSLAGGDFSQPSASQRRRQRMTRALQIGYIRLLIRTLRRPVLALGLVVALFLGALGVLGAGLIKFDFFASDPLRLFYVNLEMPADTPLADTLAKVAEAEQQVRTELKADEMRQVVGYAGQAFTETAPFFGEHYGQLLVGLKPLNGSNRSVDQLIEALRPQLTALAGPVNVSFLRLAGGPPTAKPVSIKVRGDDYLEIRAAADALQAYMAEQADFRDISDDAGVGRKTLTLIPDYDAINRAGLSPRQVLRTALLLVDGEVVADMRDQGEKVEVRVRAQPGLLLRLDQLLAFRLPLAEGGEVALGSLVTARREQSLGNIRHYNFRRAITVEADLRPGGLDTVAANTLVREHWQQTLQPRFASINLDFSGELDDIQQSLDAIAVLFLFGIGLMYLILGTQFSSYWQPFMILATVPMAFTGVVLGLLITRNPMSLFTLYGVVALAGIAVNAAIVLISAANARLAAGMSLQHATLYAARRRVIPILITSLTTIAGLFSLASGLGGHSLIWGPVATAIVSGLVFSTLLTLFMVPLLYRLSMRRAVSKRR